MRLSCHAFEKVFEEEFANFVLVRGECVCVRVRVAVRRIQRVSILSRSPILRSRALHLCDMLFGHLKVMLVSVYCDRVECDEGRSDPSQASNSFLDKVWLGHPPTP